MAHGHSHSHFDYNRAFVLGIGLNLIFVVIEAVFGIWANSLALLADAGHNLSDVLGLLLAWGASFLSKSKPTVRRTYGLRRSSILAALLNAILLLVAIGGVAWEAILRIQTPESVSGSIVIGVAAAGVVVNTLTALLFMRGSRQDLNIRGAFLHMAADAGVSLGVVMAGIGIIFTGWAWIDPVMSMLVVAVIAASTWGLLRESLDLALDAVPAGIDLPAVAEYLAAQPGITAIHDLHVWGMSTSESALTVHLVKPDGLLDDSLLAQVSDALHTKFGIAHATIQLEQGADHECRLSSEHIH